MTFLCKLLVWRNIQPRSPKVGFSSSLVSGKADAVSGREKEHLIARSVGEVSRKSSPITSCCRATTQPTKSTETSTVPCCCSLAMSARCTRTSLTTLARLILSWFLGLPQMTCTGHLDVMHLAHFLVAEESGTPADLRVPPLQKVHVSHLLR